MPSYTSLPSFRKGSEAPIGNGTVGAGYHLDHPALNGNGGSPKDGRVRRAFQQALPGIVTKVDHRLGALEQGMQHIDVRSIISNGRNLQPVVRREIDRLVEERLHLKLKISEYFEKRPYGGVRGFETRSCKVAALVAEVQLIELRILVLHLL